MIATLPTDEADAGARLARTNDAMRIAKEQHRAIPAELLQDFSQFATPAIAARAARLAAQLRLADRLLCPSRGHLERAGATVPALLRRRTTARRLPGVDDRPTCRAEHHRHELSEEPRCRAHRRPGPGARPVTLMGYFEEELGELQRAVAVP